MSEERLYMPYKELYKKCLDRHARGTTTYFHLGGPGQCSVPPYWEPVHCAGAQVL